MTTNLLTFLSSIIQSAWSMLESSSTWVVFSFVVAGLLHEFIKPEYAEDGTWLEEDYGNSWNHHFGNVSSHLQLWYDSAWNQFVLQWSLLRTYTGIYDQYTDD